MKLKMMQKEQSSKRPMNEGLSATKSQKTELRNKEERTTTMGERRQTPLENPNACIDSRLRKREEKRRRRSNVFCTTEEKDGGWMKEEMGGRISLE
ncbi:hypothetical protein SBOR_3067 [Sclerotinia borealis F-4128]|uniref:Uncharacterized protein n=1 Tax=Sclerotinia borealis (strain F-4128) TaxID=1432307 RepID=W9CPY1_SCLBF|nr:hypothetical protein SBOR_3067 [Sclerotinia borealis F-4128]